MRIETGRFSVPFCPDAEKRYFQDLLNRVVARSTNGLTIVTDPKNITDETERSLAGWVVWKRREYGMKTGLCISGKSAGYLVYYDPLRIREDVGRLIAIDGAGFDVVEATSLIESYRLPEALRDNLFHTVTQGGDGSLATALTILLTELGHPVDTEKFIANIRRAGLRYSE